MGCTLLGTTIVIDQASLCKEIIDLFSLIITGTYAPVALFLF